MPNILIHALSNVLLVYGIILYNKYKKKKYNLKYIILMVFSSHLIDLDHLLADPIYDPLRCSINFHFLHKWYLFPLYIVGSIFGRYKYLFWAILLHLVLDLLDCLI